MTHTPRLNLAELLLEISLTSKRHLVVEGASDARFFRAWALDIAHGERVVVTHVDNIEIGFDELEALRLNDGQRSRAIYVALRAAESQVDMRSVADRDCGHQVDEHNYATLLWTDFPAIESYAVQEATLNRANLLSFGGRLPEASELLPSLTYALRELFAVRLQNEHLPKPRYTSGFRRSPRLLEDFDVTATVAASIRGEAADYPRPQGDDPRSFAYGHDVGELLLCAYGNALRTQAGLSTREAVEGALLMAMQIVGSYRNEPLFRALEEWVAD